MSKYVNIPIAKLQTIRAAIQKIAFYPTVAGIYDQYDALKALGLDYPALAEGVVRRNTVFGEAAVDSWKTRPERALLPAI